MINAIIEIEERAEKQARALRYEQAIDTHNALREECVKLIRAEPSLLSTEAWLAAFIDETDISVLEAGPQGITGRGGRRMSSTQDWESFYFAIPWERFVG